MQVNFSKTNRNYHNFFSVYLVCQSIGAAGLASSTTAGLFGGGTVLGGLFGAAMGKKKKPADANENQPQPSEEECEAAKENQVQPTKEQSREVREDQAEPTEEESEGSEDEENSKGESLNEDANPQEEESVVVRNVTAENANTVHQERPPNRYVLLSMDNSVLNLSPTLNVHKLI